jgi:hypothetical protein
MVWCTTQKLKFKKLEKFTIYKILRCLFLIKYQNGEKLLIILCFRIHYLIHYLKIRYLKPSIVDRVVSCLFQSTLVYCIGPSWPALTAFVLRVNLNCLILRAPLSKWPCYPALARCIYYTLPFIHWQQACTTNTSSTVTTHCLSYTDSRHELPTPAAQSLHIAFHILTADMHNQHQQHSHYTLPFIY